MIHYEMNRHRYIMWDAPQYPRKFLDMVPMYKNGNNVQVGHNVECNGRWYKVISKLGDDGFKTTYQVIRNGELSEIILNNLCRFEIRIPGMKT